MGRTFALSYERLGPDDPTGALARDLLARAAAFAPGEPLPGDLLRVTFELPKDDPEAAQRLEDALNRLVDELGLLEAEEGGMLALHRLVSAYVRGEEPERFAAARHAVERTVAAEANRIVKEGRPAPLLVWEAHFRFLTGGAAGRDSQQAHYLLNALGMHLTQIADYGAARAALERALAIDERTFGPDHPRAAEDVNNLGDVLQKLDDFPGARAAFERTLAIHKRAFGPDHPDVAICVGNLGLVLQKLGDFPGARVAYERAQGILEPRLGANHPTVRAIWDDIQNLDAE